MITPMIIQMTQMMLFINFGGKCAKCIDPKIITNDNVTIDQNKLDKRQAKEKDSIKILFDEAETSECQQLQTKSV